MMRVNYLPIHHNAHIQELNSETGHINYEELFDEQREDIFSYNEEFADAIPQNENGLEKYLADNGYISTSKKTSYGKSIENTEFFKENGGLDASDYISIHSRKHMYDPDTVSTPKKTQYGKDVNVGKLCEDTIMKPDEVIYNKDQNVMIYKKEYPFNISTSDTPTGTHRVFIPLNTQGKKTIRMSQFPLVGGN